MKTKKEKDSKHDNEKKEKKAKSGKDDKVPHTPGVKRKLEEGECDPDPSETKRHERYVINQRRCAITF